MIKFAAIFEINKMNNKMKLNVCSLCMNNKIKLKFNVDQVTNISLAFESA